MDKVQVLVRSHSDFAGGVDELTFRGTGTLEKIDYGYRLRYTAQNELDGSAVASEVRLETQQRRAVVITESKDGGYGLLLDPQRQTVTQIAGGDGGALTLHVDTKEVSWHLPLKGRWPYRIDVYIAAGHAGAVRPAPGTDFDKRGEGRMNMIESAKAQVRQLTVAAYERLRPQGCCLPVSPPSPAVEIPKDTANGDYTTTLLPGGGQGYEDEPPSGGADPYRQHDAGGQLLHLRGDCRSRLYELPPGRQVVRRHRLRH